MIKFIDILNESKQVGPLYHWTDIYNSYNIISGNVSAKLSLIGAFLKGAFILKYFLLLLNHSKLVISLVGGQ